ncbi:MAG: ribonuclease R, partial [Lachnospiraceae bacterium]|nr:ribonuclease R [Lachnospiraceae bacterium]
MAFENRKEMIKAFLESADYTPMKAKEMAGLLGVPKNEREEFQAILNDLAAEGGIRVDGAGRYIPEGANIRQGTFQGTLKGFGFVLV